MLSKLRSRWPRIAISFFLCLVSLGLYLRVSVVDSKLGLLGIFNDIELMTLDERFLIRGTTKPDPSIVIVAIDQKSQDELGRWPFPRGDFARATDFLRDAGARVVVFDINFPLPSRKSVQETGNSGRESAARPPISKSGSHPRSISTVIESDDDQEFSEALSKYPNAILGYFFLPRGETVKQDPERVKDFVKYLSFSAYTVFRSEKRDETGHKFDGLSFEALSPNLGSFTIHARNFGFFNLWSDTDEAVRRVPLVARYEGLYCPSLAVAAKLAFTNARADRTAVVFNRNGLEGVMAGEMVPTSPSGFMQINFHGPARSYPHYSFTDVVKRRLSTEAFRGKLVLIGTTAAGLADFVPTPFQKGGFPVVEVHANAIDNLLNRDFIRRDLRESFFDLLIIILLSLGVGTVVTFLSPRRAIAVVVICLGLFIWLSYYLFAYHRIWISTFIPVATLITNYVALNGYRILFEEQL